MNLRLRPAESGAVALETAVSIPIFIFLVFCTFQISITLYQYATLQNALARAARLATLGLASNSADAVRVKVEQYSGLPIESGNFRLCDAGALHCYTNTGAPLEWIYMEARTALTPLIGGSPLMLKASVLVRNEPKDWSGGT